MNDVKVHYNSDKPAQLQALAYAQGTDIHVAPGQEQHLPHEAWHVVQQKQGRVSPTLQAKGLSINDNAGLEQEADVMGAKAAQMRVEQHSVPGIREGGHSEHHLHQENTAQGPFQLRADVYSRAHFANPEGYLAGQFAGTNIVEDAGSGGIKDKPMQNLVLTLARPVPRAAFVKQLSEAAQTEADRLAVTALKEQVYDRTSAHTWVLKNTLRLSNLAPTALTYHHEVADGAGTHTFHKDRGYVVLTEAALIAQGLNSQPERAARMRVANGPGGAGWIRGHYGVDNKKHRFIEHIHVDKDKAPDERFEIYNADSADVGVTANQFNIADRGGFNDANDGRAQKAAEDVEGDAKQLSWETYEATLGPEPDYY